MTKRPKRVQAPEGCKSWLTPGKIYDVIGFWVDWDDEYGHYFNIIDEKGREIDCSEKKCPNLYGKDWIIVETETED
jgi:hypothetical protein